MVAAGWQKNLLAMLKGEAPATAANLDRARKVLTTSLDILRRAAALELPEPIVIPRAVAPPTIDGRLDDDAWRHAATFDGLYRFNSTVPADAPETRWFIAWDDQHLYFAFDCSDADIVAPAYPRDGDVYAADCVEMFILPELRLGQYWEIIISPTGSIFDSLQTKKPTEWGPVMRMDESVNGMRIGHRADGDSRGRPGYVVEVAVPFDQLPTYTRGNPPRLGDRLHLMLARLDKNADQPLTPYAFQPLFNWGHNIWNHTPVVLGE